MRPITAISITELEKGDKRVTITEFKDGYVGICTEIDGKKNCYVPSQPDPNAVPIAEAWYMSLGFEVKKKLKNQLIEEQVMNNQSNGKKELPVEFKELEKKYGYLYAYSAYKYLTNFKKAMDR